MTQRRIAIAGLFLGLLLAPGGAAAQWAVSPYVQAVLQRSEDGVRRARQLRAPEPEVDALDLRRAATAAYGALVDTRQRITIERRALSEHTACLRADLFLLERQFERVRQETLLAIDRKNRSSVTLMLEVLRFLSDRYEAVLHGARDPAQTDSDWHATWQFDPPDWQATYGGILVSGEACPFHTDYLPPSVGGYGCDATALRQVLRGLSASGAGGSELRAATQAELASLEAGLRAAADYELRLLALGQASGQLDRIVSGGPALPSLSPPPQHRPPLSGCFRTRPLPPEVVRHELRGPFSLERDDERLLTIFREQRRSEERERPLPSYLDAGRTVVHWILGWLGLQEGRELGEFQGTQGERESMTVAATVDPSGSFERLTISVREFSDLASGRDGVRAFVRDFAYFLRLSCVFRPCSSRLERVMRVVVTDECFPYANGEFLRDAPRGKPRWELCKEKAGIR